MTLNENLTIAIPSIISILGFAVNIGLTKKEIKSIRDNKIFDNKIEFYLDFIKESEQINDNWFAAFDTNYYEKLKIYKPEFKLFASEKIVKDYKTLLEKIYNLQKEYECFCEKNNPTKDEKNSMTYYEDDEEREVNDITEEKLQSFEREKYEYKMNNYNSVQEILLMLKNLWNDMRSDIGNEEIVY